MMRLAAGGDEPSSTIFFSTHPSAPMSGAQSNAQVAKFTYALAHVGSRARVALEVVTPFLDVALKLSHGTGADGLNGCNEL